MGYTGEVSLNWDDPRAFTTLTLVSGGQGREPLTISGPIRRGQRHRFRWRCCKPRALQAEGQTQSRVDILHVHRVKNAQPGLKSGLVESYDLADVHDTIAIKAGGPRRKSDVTWRSGQSEVRCDCRYGHRLDARAVEGVSGNH